MRKASGINMSDVKVNNRALILNQLKEGKKSRKDIAEKIKLTPAAVTILVKELIQEGCISECGQIENSSRVGRKKVYIELNRNYKYAIGVNIEPNHVCVGIANVKAEIIKYEEMIITGISVKQIMKMIVKTCLNLLWNLNISKNDVLGIGVGIVGIVDSENGVSKQAYGLWNKEVDIRNILSNKLKLPVLVENNVRVLALAEMELTEHKYIKNMVFIKYGPGIGSAIITNEEIYKGSYNSAGELGHMIIDMNGKVCKCGQKGCLETVASMLTLIDEIKNEFSSETYPILYKSVCGSIDKINEDIIIEAYKLGEKKIVDKINKAWRYLGTGIVNILRFYDPHKIIIYGELFHEQVFLEKLIEEVNNQGHESNVINKIERSILIQEKCIGGVVSVIKELFYETGAIIPV